MNEQHLLDSPTHAARRLLKTMSNDNQIVDQRSWLDAMEALRRSLTVPHSQQPADVASLQVSDDAVYAVTLKGKRIALATLRENAEHAARSEPAAVVVPCRLVPIAGPEASFAGLTPTATHHQGLDTDELIFFYEQEFYVLSNFSSFSLQWRGERFDTSEAAYHFEKFPRDQGIRMQILRAASAHEAYKIAERYKKDRRPDWDSMKVQIMREILRAKARQHEYVRRKLLETGDRVLVENSWRDDYWGWGPNRDGQNMLGRLWMEVRTELRSAPKGGA